MYATLSGLQWDRLINVKLEEDLCKAKKEGSVDGSLPFSLTQLTYSKVKKQGSAATDQPWKVDQ
jgi:hypothetical protein